jgi:hypothetical protein
MRAKTAAIRDGRGVAAAAITATKAGAIRSEELAASTAGRARRRPSMLRARR